MESEISDTLLQIRDRVAGLKLYRHIYNEDHELDQQLQSRIVHTYDSFICFCIAAIKYYSKGSLSESLTILSKFDYPLIPLIGRWAKALWGSSVTLENSVLQVQKAIVEVRYMSEELLNKNVDAIKRRMIG